MMLNPEYRPTHHARPHESALELDLTDWLETVPGHSPGVRPVTVDNNAGPVTAFGFFTFEGRCRGVLLFFHQPPAEYGPPGMVYIFVSRAYRGRNIARDLLREAIKHLDIRVEDQSFTVDGAHVTNRFILDTLRELGEL